MTTRLKLLLGFAAIIIALALVGGTAGHQAMNKSAHSPYISALTNFGVGTAEANPHHNCNNHQCGSLQGIVTCTEETVGTNCTVSAGVCTVVPCR